MMAFTFNRYVQKGNELINEVAEELGYPDDTEKAHRILKAVLHALRDNIPVEENLHLIAQLPMMIKGVYVDNWKVYGDGSNVRHLDDFILKVQLINENNSRRDLESPEETRQAVEAVFKVLKKHVSEGEIDDVVNMLPREIQPLMQEA